jgi:hypothetical protein
MVSKFSKISLILCGALFLVSLFLFIGINKVSESFNSTSSECGNYDNRTKCLYKKCKWNKIGCYDKDNKYMGKDRVTKLACNPDYGNKWYDDEFCS